jgi:hypothetical protein
LSHFVFGQLIKKKCIFINGNNILRLLALSTQLSSAQQINNESRSI